MKRVKLFSNTLLKKGKKRLVGVAVAGALLTGANFAVPQMVNTPFGAMVVNALTLPSGATQVGTINNAPVIKSPTNNTNSQSFKDIISTLLEGVETPPYVVNQVYWGNQSSLTNGKNISTFGQSPTAVFGADGFLPTDKAVLLNKGGQSVIKNVGTAINTATGETIPVALGITFEGASLPTGESLSPVLMGAKSQNGVITLAWGAPTNVGNGESGGSTEGGEIGGGTNDGTGFWFIDQINFRITLLNNNTGAKLPDNTLMPIKMSDIDSNQLATMDGVGAKGYILSPDTALSQSGNGFRSSSNGAIIEDTVELSSNSYIVLKHYNSNSVQYQYMDNKNNHLDIVTGIFGSTPWNLIDLMGGYVEIDKSTLQFGKEPWNGLYNFSDLSFQLINEHGKVVETIKLDKTGRGKSGRVPMGDYTLRETSTNWTSIGQTVNADATVKVEAGKTITVRPKNIAVTGEITIKKTGVESGADVWNGNYSLEGNEFKLTSQTDKKTYTVITDKTGTGNIKNLPLGVYDIEEVKSSAGLVNTFKPQTVTLTYKDNKTEVIFGSITGTNQEVKGENSLQKVDKETELTQNGKADMKMAKYQLFYNDTSTGSSPHKQGDSVKWTDVPAPTLLKGEKVIQAVIGGKEVSFGDQVVIDVDDTNLMIGVGNLSLGKYYYMEVDAGEGYVTDPTKHTFELTKKDDQTKLIVGADKRSEEQVIKARITLDKMVTLPNTQGGSGYNGIEFTATPLKGTVADPVLFKTGVNPTTGDDGFASGDLVYGDWKITETKGVEGYDDVKPVYIHMETDAKKDVLTISASYYDDFSEPFSKRSFALLDSSTGDHPNGEGTVGSVNASTPTISLSTLHFNDNPEEKPVEPIELPIKDVIKQEDGESIHEGDVALSSDFVYVLQSSVLNAKRGDVTDWSIDDRYDETYDQYKDVYHVHASKDFATYKAGDKLPDNFFSVKKEKGRLVFSAKKAFLKVINDNKDKEIGFTIHADFYRFGSSDKVVNVFEETINDENEQSNEVYTKTPTVEPHKFDLSKEQVDLTGDSLLDDDGELEDRYKDTNDNPYADKVANNEKENINMIIVKPNRELVYQLWLDTRAFDGTSLLTNLQMVDMYDSKSLDLDVSKVKVYDAEGTDKTEHFKITDEEGRLVVQANAFTTSKDSKGKEHDIVDTSLIAFNQFYKIDVPVKVKEDVKIGTDIINVANQEWTDIEAIDNEHITEKRVNKVDESDDPIKDVIKVEDGESIHEGDVALASDFFYVLQSSVVKPNREAMTSWVINDDYDETFDRYNGEFHVHASTDFGEYKAGDELPETFFTATEEEGRVIFTADPTFIELVNEQRDKEVGFTIHASFYRFAPSDEVINIFTESVDDENKQSNEVVTKTPSIEPHKFDLSEEKVDLEGDRLLDDDSEMKDRYEESNNDPYADKPDNNEKQNINTITVKAGQELVYQLWLDTRAFDETSKLTSLQMVDTYDSKSLDLDVSKVKVYDAKGSDMTKQFAIEDKDGELVIKANVFKEGTNSKGEAVKLIDTDAIPLGQFYKIDVPMTVKADIQDDTEIINVARQEWVDSDNLEGEHITEKRVNTVKKDNPVVEAIKQVLPQTGDSPEVLAVKIAGIGLVLVTVVFMNRERIKGLWKRRKPETELIDGE